MHWLPGIAQCIYRVCSQVVLSQGAEDSIGWILGGAQSVVCLCSFPLFFHLARTIQLVSQQERNLSALYVPGLFAQSDRRCSPPSFSKTQKLHRLFVAAQTLLVGCTFCVPCAAHRCSSGRTASTRRHPPIRAIARGGHMFC